MKNKRMLIFLFIGVSIVWSLIAFRIYQSIKKPLDPINLKQMINEKIIKKKDYVLIADYPDPFLGELMPEQNSSQTKKITTIKSIIHKEISWPTLSFKGTIIKKNPKTEYCMLTINDKEVMMKINDAIDGIILRKIYKDSIKVEFNKSVKTVLK